MQRPPWRRILVALVVMLVSLTRALPAARAASPILTLSAPSNLPHAAETITGAGFDPLMAVALSITSSTGSTSFGTVTTDAIGGFVDTVTLPLTLDATAPNVIAAHEASGSVAASVELTGLAVSPVIGNGRQITGRIGQTLSLLAIGFAPTEPITASVGGVPATLPDGVAQLVTTGEGIVNLTVGVPIGATPGQNTLDVTGSATGLGQRDSASLPINVVGNQNLVVTPNAAPAGRTVDVVASGYAPSEAISIDLGYLDTAIGHADAQANAHADGDGNLETRFTIPASAQTGSGATLTARGIVSGLSLSAGITILGQPSVSISEATVEPGDHIAVSGSGFRPGERLFLTSGLFSTPGVGLIADGSGSFSAGATVYAPLAPGAYTVSVSGVNGDQASTRVIVPVAAVPQLHVTPAQAVPGTDVQVIGSQFLAGELVRLSLGPTVITPTSGPIMATASGTFAVKVQIPSTPASGPYLLTAQGLRTGAQGSSTLHVQLPPVSQVYFAEGYTGQGPAVNFSESIDVLNTNAVTATGRIEYFISSGLTSTMPLAIPARSQLREDVVRDVGINRAVSALVQMDQPVTATRTISRTTTTGAVLGESISSGEQDLSTIWYFAEGYTGVSFQEYLALFNPGNVPASVEVQPAGVAGSLPLAPIDQTVPAHGRITINVRAAFPNRQIGLIVQCDQQIAAERTMYWGDGAGSGKFGTAVSGGVQALAALWTFPYASTAGRDQVFLTFVDPTTQAAHVQITAYSDSGNQGLIQSLTVEPGSRATLALPVRSAGPMAIVASSDVPVIGEEAQYFGGSPNIGKHTGSVLSGIQRPAAQWFFPGFGGSAFTAEGWYILNTGVTEARLTATLYSVQAQPVQVSFRAAPGRLTSVAVQSVSELQSGSPSAWSSTVPVVMVQVLHGPSGAIGTLLEGIPAGPS